MDGFQFGRRVHYWRTRRRLTQPEFAALMGKSVRWVEDLEGIVNLSWRPWGRDDHRVC